jgi:homoserine dehydrogenase
LLPEGLDIVGFGPIGRELAKRLVSERDLASRFSVVSIQDSTGAVYPRKKSEVLKAIDWKNSGRKLSESKFGGKPKRKSSIFIDLTNSDYSKAEEARKRAISSLREGKHFVSASKVALSNYFSEIFSYAKRRNLEIGYGATICGARHAISVAKNIEWGEIESASAVLNASTTLILSMLEEEPSLTFEEACKKAAESGVLESDWSIDLDGIDAAAKTAILANVLFPKSKVSLGGVKVRGIRDEMARELIQSGRSNPLEKTRLISEITKNSVSVEPRKISSDSILAVRGRFNAVSLNTRNLGEIAVRNLGGGVLLTASVIISDLKRISPV